MPIRADRSAGRLVRGVPPYRGFTLIEVVVVMLILTIILGLAGMRLTRDRGDDLREEARRLALVLQNAQQQAILEGRPVAFSLKNDGYVFLQLDAKGKLVPIEKDELLGPHVLPPSMTIGPVKPKPRDMSSQAQEKEKKSKDLIVFDPSGEFPVFTMVLSIGDLTWYVRGSDDGQIQSTPAAEPPAA